MNLLFKNRTKYTKECYQEFLEFHNKKFGFSSNLYTLIVILLIAFCAVIQAKGGHKQITFVFLLFFILFIAWRIFHPIKEIKNEYNSTKIKKEATFIFRFYKNYFTISDGIQIEKWYYWKLYKVFETTDYFYIYIDRKYAFLVRKSGFSSDVVEDFTKFLKKKCFLKYRNINFH